MEYSQYSSPDASSVGGITTGKKSISILYFNFAPSSSFCRLSCDMLKITRISFISLSFMVISFWSPYALAESYFTIIINGKTFNIHKQQLHSEKRGQENPADIFAIGSEDSGLKLPLNQLEESMGVPALSRLARFIGRPLDYLLRYGTDLTRWALLEYYPLHTVLFKEESIETKNDTSLSEPAQECTACSDHLLKSRTVMETDCGHLLHLGCLEKMLNNARLSVSSVKCPQCTKELTTLEAAFMDRALNAKFLRSASRGDLITLTALLEAGVDVDATDRADNTALHLAAQTGHYDIADLLIKFGVETSRKNNNGLSPKELAVASGQVAITLMLTEAAKTPNIFFSAGHGKTGVIKKWLEEGNDPGLKREQDGMTLLHLATRNNHPDIVQLLLAQGKSLSMHEYMLSVTDSNRRTPLHYACDQGYTKMVEILLDYQPENEIQDHQGQTALMLARVKGHNELIRLLERSARREETVAETSFDSAIPQPVNNSQPALQHTDRPQPTTGSGDVDYYTLHIAQTEIRIPQKNVRRKLASTLINKLNPQCLDCGKIIGSSLVTHVNNHVIECEQCRQFKPPADKSITERKSALKHHQQTCRGRRLGVPDYKSMLAERNYSVMAFFSRYATSESFQRLLATGDASLAPAMKMHDALNGQTVLHLLFAYAPPESIVYFLQSQKHVLNKGGELLAMRDSKGWTAMHMLFHRQPPDIVKLFLTLNKTLLINNPSFLKAYDTNRLSPLHLLFKHAPPNTTDIIFADTIEILNSSPALIGLVDNKANTPFHYLLEKNNTKVTELFLRHYPSWLKSYPKLLLFKNRKTLTLLHAFCLTARPDQIRQLFSVSAQSISPEELVFRNPNQWSVLDCLQYRVQPETLAPWLEKHLSNDQNLLLILPQDFEDWAVWLKKIQMNFGQNIDHTIRVIVQHAERPNPFLPVYQNYQQPRTDAGYYPITGNDTSKPHSNQPGQVTGSVGGVINSLHQAVGNR